MGEADLANLKANLRGALIGRDHPNMMRPASSITA